MKARCLTAIPFLVAIATPVAAAPRARNVEIRYDLRQQGAAALQVWVDCERDATDIQMSTCRTGGADDPRKRHLGPAAFNFRLKASDRIVFVLWFAKADGTRGEVVYAVTGENVHDKDLEALKAMFGGGAVPGPRVAARGDPAVEIRPLTDDLVAGGRLAVTFNVKTRTTDATGKPEEAVTDSAGPFTFRVEAEEPRVTVSTGIAVSTAPEPDVVLLKSATIVTFEKDGKTQQAYQQVVALREDDDSVKPIQSLVAMANFRLAPRVYASLGFQLNQSLFEEPLLGGTYRHPLGRLGLNVTVAVHLSREEKIAADSGFAVGDIIDPTIGLTADEIPTERKYHPRLAFGFTLDF